MALLSDVIRRGTTAAKPAATAVAGGTLYFDTDLDKLQRSSGSAWEDVERADPASGSGSVVADSNLLTSGDKSLNTIGWQNFDTTIDITLAAATGNWVEVGLGAFTAAAVNTLAWDVVTVVGGSPVSSVAGAVAIASRPSNGNPGWYCPPSASTTAMNRTVSGSIMYQLGAGDVSGGNVVLRVQVNPNSTTARSVSANANTPFIFWAKVYS